MKPTRLPRNYNFLYSLYKNRDNVGGVAFGAGLFEGPLHPLDPRIVREVPQPAWGCNRRQQIDLQP